MNKQQFLELTGLTENQFLGIDEIGGNLYLQNVTSIPEGFNPTVGGYLDLKVLLQFLKGLIQQ
jgi:hypothetical protein